MFSAVNTFLACDVLFDFSTTIFCNDVGIPDNFLFTLATDFVGIKLKFPDFDLFAQ